MSGFDPARVAYATIVISGPTEDAVDATLRPLFAQIPFSRNQAVVRMTAVAMSRDAMSLLDAVEALAETHVLDHFERDDCVKEILQLDTWDACLAKFAEWGLDYRDGELVDARDSGSGPQGENSRSEVEGEAPQSGDSAAGASPNPGSHQAQGGEG